eukprot:CAMPEP_0175689468 /NCGR_PEP_ID=MMETSP0097-20121207/29399_1 /TAXON_ID=311494 /ORGANISM="Alexandrium monilatum, Strain CCMP3105" /LENGTH=655 /DNA_ID=CAMNT_0016996491 /DNA_START=20 /DNA_END=1987 /DNA_ORIENTATION=+
MAGDERKRREELKRRCFRSCDVDGDGFLCKREMKTFAGYVGFDGTEEEWDQEYRKLCADFGAQPSIGMPQAALLQLLDDESDTGCFCTDEELMEILGIEEKALADREADSTLTPKSEEDLSIAGDEGGEAEGDRGDCMVFFIGADFGTDEATLRRVFEKGGTIKEFQLYRMLDGRSRGMGLVTYSSAVEAQHAITTLNQVYLDGRAISVQAADLSRIRNSGSSLGGGSQGDAGWSSADDHVMDAGSRSARFGGLGGRGRGHILGGGLGRGWGGGRGAKSRGRGGRVDYGGYSDYDDYDAGFDGCDDSSASRSGYRRTRASDGRTVFFGGVSSETTGDHLLAQFRTVGRVQAFWLFTMPEGWSRGMGLVQYQTAREAWAAVHDLSGAIVDGREMIVVMDQVGVMNDPDRSGSNGVAGKGRSSARAVSSGPSWSRWEQQAAPCETNRVFFAGAPFDMPEGVLRAHFEEYGPLRSLTVFRLRDGRSRGMGICTFVSSKVAGEVLDGGIQINGWALFLQEDTSQFSFMGTSGPSVPSRGRAPDDEHPPYSLGAARTHGTGKGPRSSPYGGSGPMLDGVNSRKSVFFANASFQTPESAIHEHFEEIGRIRSLTLFRTPEGRSRGMGVVEYMNAASAMRAYYNLHGVALDGRPLVVDEHRP